MSIETGEAIHSLAGYGQVKKRQYPFWAASNALLVFTTQGGLETMSGVTTMFCLPNLWQLKRGSLWGKEFPRNLRNLLDEV